MKEPIPPLNSLRAFEAAARHESFLAAAKELRISPGAITRHIKLLEEFLDAALFARRSNGVDLTREGQGYASKVTKFFDELAFATAEIQRPEKWHRLVIPTLPVFADRWLNRRLPAFLDGRRHTSVQVEFHDGINGVLANEVDAWIVYSDGDHPGCTATRLFGEHLVPVASPDLRARLPDHATARDVTSLPLLHNIGWMEDWPAWATAMGLVDADLSDGPCFVLYSELIQAAVDSLGVAMGHSALIADELESGRLTAFEGLEFASPNAYHLVMTAAAESTQLGREFKEWIESECRGR